MKSETFQKGVNAVKAGAAAYQQPINNPAQQPMNTNQQPQQPMN